MERRYDGILTTSIQKTIQTLDENVIEKIRVFISKLSYSVELRVLTPTSKLVAGQLLLGHLLLGYLLLTMKNNRNVI